MNGEPNVQHGGMIQSHPSDTDVLLPLATVEGGLVVVGEGNDDAASVGLGAAGAWAKSDEEQP